MACRCKSGGCGCTGRQVLSKAVLGGFRTGPAILRAGPAILRAGQLDLSDEGWVARGVTRSAARGSMPSGKLEEVEFVRNDSITCDSQRKTGKGDLSCSYAYKATNSSDAGNVVMIHIVKNEVSRGVSCNGSGYCQCRPTEVEFVEYAEFNKRQVQFSDELKDRAYGCGCYIKLTGTFFLLGADLPGTRKVIDGLKSKPQMSKPGPPPYQQLVGIAPYTIGNEGFIETGFWKSAWVDPSSSFREDVQAIALDSQEQDCSRAWNCCGAEAPPVPMVGIRALEDLSRSLFPVRPARFWSDE